MCAACRKAAAAEKVWKGDGPYCKIHRTKGHGLQECYRGKQLVKKQRAEYDKRDKKKKDIVMLSVRAEAVEQIAPANPFGTKENPPGAKRRRSVMM